MARLSRIVVPGYPHRVSQGGVRPMDVFHSEGDRGQYLGCMGVSSYAPPTDSRPASVSRVHESISGRVPDSLWGLPNMIPL